jgi:threonine dehydrogenase-like Zn-dependent dehydrogenase
MRALIFDGHSIKLDRARPAPQPRDEHAIVKVLRAAVSDSDLEAVRGFNGFTGVLGQQFVGQVESMRSKQPSLAGKRVVGSMISSCSQCDMCQAGLSAHCRNRTMAGLQGQDGCFAEMLSVPVSMLFPIPEHVDNDHAVFAQDVAAAIQSCNRLTIQGRPFVSVLGDGAAALIKAQLMSKLNASVRVIGRNVDRLTVCEKWGVKHRPLEEIGLRADQDIVVECTGTADGLRTAMQLARPRAKIVLTTLSSEQGSLALNQAVLNEFELIGAFGGPMKEAVAMLARREVDVLSLISKRMKLDDGPMIFKTAAQPNILKVLIDP